MTASAHSIQAQRGVGSRHRYLALGRSPLIVIDYHSRWIEGGEVGFELVWGLVLKESVWRVIIECLNGSRSRWLSIT